MPLQAESTLTCMVDGAMVKKRRERKYRPANGIFFYVQREPVPPPRQEFLVSHFYRSQAEDAPCLEPPMRTHGRLGAALPGGAQHGRPQQPTAGLKTSVSATNRTHIQR